MTNDTTEAMPETEVTAETTPAPQNSTSQTPVKGRARGTIAALGAALVAVVVAIVFGLQWRSASAELADRTRADDLRQQAVDTARDYTARSLTYDYRNLDGFFAGVQDGTADALRDRFESVREPLSSIMTQSQVVATGKVLSAAVDSEDGNEYEVTVYATQQTQNLQQPDPGDVPNLLTVTVTNDDGNWVVSDYGPKS